MTVEEKITSAIATGKSIAKTWATKFITLSQNGDSVGLDELKLVVLVEWINILEDYDIENFGDSGSTTPDIECLTQAQALLLADKINALEC